MRCLIRSQKPNDGLENIVEVVRDPAGQPADRLHLFRLGHLLFQPSAFGNVARNDNEMRIRRAMISDCRDGRLKPPLFPVKKYRVCFPRVLPGLHRFRKRSHADRGGVRGKYVFHRPADKDFGRGDEPLPMRRGQSIEAAIPVDLEKEIGNRVKHRLQVRMAVQQRQLRALLRSDVHGKAEHRRHALPRHLSGPDLEPPGRAARAEHPKRCGFFPAVSFQRIPHQLERCLMILRMEQRRERQAFQALFRAGH